ncbi:MAG: PD40 domain-containing protein [Muribaculaceae bacterium]|nr:PD40 domain-containing protein [Muribaculaceae bacterium]
MNLRNSIYCILTALLSTACSGYHKPDRPMSGYPDIFPDYTGVTVAPNLAPLNFRIDMPAEAYQTAIGAFGAEPEIVLNGNPADIPVDKWHKLLAEHRGDSIAVEVSLRIGGEWVAYEPFPVYVSRDSIDGWLAYRMLYPGYELWSEMGIYQRDLSNFDQTAILENKDVEKMCLNCHSFSAGDPNTMMLHVRGKKGGTVIVSQGSAKKVNPVSKDEFPNGAAYPAWSPRGRFIAFASNQIQQFFHRSGPKTTEVVDLSADLLVYDSNTGKAYSDSAVSVKEYFETFPVWNPAGDMIYFCRAEKTTGLPLDSVRYNLCRVPFDTTTCTFGAVERLYDAAADNHSCSFPRVSPDGRWLMFTRSGYGNFSIWHTESQLCVMDLRDLSIRELEEVNAPDAVDSYHSWSGNSRWFVFSSKRIDGLWAQPFIAHFDPATGKAGKPVLLPQRDPEYYKECLMTFNIPELIKEPVTQDFVPVIMN